ncbi:hypothetical protein ACFOSV_04335 [Algoriphagus namhaensis]|uniref:Uncharacterized protein n=1 Tax=Algoriphagus namhaensis TaxID=915353 RepID=A0ABV8AP42_9BACT
MKQLLTPSFFLILLLSCSDPQPRVVYDNTSDTFEDQILIDTSAIALAGLPIHFDSTTFLIHPIGQYTPEERGSKIYLGSSSAGSSGLAFAYRSGNSISGNLDNLKFQHIDSAELLPLTDNQLKIRSFTFFRSAFHASKKETLIYTVTDKDSNKDKKLDDRDIESLYISSIDGQNFRKLSPDSHELVEWKVMEIQDRIYFITSEDIDKNGEFDQSDQLHYYYLDLKSDSMDVVEYNPINN